jgi:thymidylate kinase
MRSVLEAFERERVTYCVLRDADRLDRRGGEVDLLVAQRDLARLPTMLCPLGFVPVRAWGYSPHRFFLAYDGASDGWLRLDVIPRLSYGHTPVTGLSLTNRLLANRRCLRPVFVPAPEDELVALLLHCVLEKRRFDPSRRARCRALCREVTDFGSLSALLAAYWSPAMTWPRLRNAIDGDDWEGLLRAQAAVGARQVPARLGAHVTRIRIGILRRLNRALPVRPRGLTVALLAPDGAGKSTLAAAIRDSFQVPVRSMYMGLYRRGQATTPRWRLPGLGFLGRLLRQWTRHLIAHWHCEYGRVVIFDRHSYDARLTSFETQAWYSRWRRWLLAHACPAPQLVLLLDAPGEVLYRRKQEHTVAKLEHMRHGYLKLVAEMSEAVVVDANRDAENVRRDVTRVIWHAYTSPLRGQREVLTPASSAAPTKVES